VGEGIRERLGNGLSIFSRLRIQVSHGSIIAFAALVTILFVAFTVRILPLRWENLTQGTALLNEFDPYYQFSITQHMVQNGLFSPYWPTHWINTQKWFPDGLDMSTALPALPMTAAAVFQIISLFGAKIDLMTFCSIFPAIVAVVSCTILYLVGKDMGGKAVGLFSALFLALAPSFLQRSSLGFFDTEVPGVLGLVLFIFLFLRSVDSNRSLRASLLYSLGAGAALAYFIAGWGAAYYLIALAVLFVFILVLLKRYTPRMLINYSLTFGLALFIGTKVPYISLGYVTSGAVLPVAAVFIVLVVAEILRNNISARTKLTLMIATLVAIISSFVVLGVTGLIGGITGKFVTVLDPFIRAGSPLIDSVAEQRIAAWGNLYLEVGVSLLFFFVGLYFVLKNPTNRNIFLLLFAVTSLYFAASMIRLLVLFAPAFAIIAGIGIITMLKPFVTLLREAPKTIVKSKRRMPRVSKEYSGIAILVIFMLLVSSLAFSPQTGGMPRAISQAYTPTAISGSSLPVGGAGLSQPVTAWLDALGWMKNNVHSTDAVVMWWDYGNWLADIGNVTSLADNTTTNSTQIANVGFIFMGNQNESMKMLNSYGQQHTKYIAVFLVLGISQSSSGSSSYIAYPAGYGDEGKWSWMARISGTDKQRLIDQGFMNPATAWTNETTFGATNSQTNQWQWNDQGLNCTVYELMNYAEVQYCNSITQATNNQITVTPDQTTTQPTYFKEAFFAGLNTSPTQYGGLIPIVAIYSIDWAKYNADQGITP
jgi:dolichyl-diphosphooligosaccharide--protein glycosyltransferase